MSRCVCDNNWRLIVHESEKDLGKTFVDENGKKFRFFGLVWAEDDYYYGLFSEDGKTRLVSCVATLETAGYKMTHYITKDDNA